MKVLAENVAWDKNRWPNFTVWELCCKCRKYCRQEYWHEPAFLDKLQSCRNAFGRPMVINSAHRCALHNAAVGGAPMSMHKKIAVDVSIRGMTSWQMKSLLSSARAAGFTGFGYYSTFLHLDCGRPRFWFSGKAGREKWQSLI